MKIPKFLLFQLLILLAIVGIGYLPMSLYLTQKEHLFCILASVICSVVGAVAYIISYSGMEKRDAVFMTYFMGGMFLRLFVSILFLTIISFTIKEIALHFTLAFFLSYLIFTPFEVFSLMSKLRPHSNKKGNNSSSDEDN